MNARLCPCSHKPSSRAAKSGVSGFTLIEVMVVVAIIAILAALVIPEYSDYVTRSRIPEATSALANKRARMELFYDNNRSYAAAPDCASDSTTSRYFIFDGVCDASTYVLSATGTGAMDGFVFTINQVNAKATTDVPDGWTENASCWVSRKGGAC